MQDPSSHKPICFLDVEGKLYEYLVYKQLKIEIERTVLSEKQYGFKEGRQNVPILGLNACIKCNLIQKVGSLTLKLSHKVDCSIFTLALQFL